MPFRYGVRLGADLLRRGRIRDAVPYLVKPVNYWRTAEYRWVLEAVDVRPDERVLDIGSPKLLALYLAEEKRARVRATDIESYFLEKLERIRQVRGLSPERFALETQDGRKLSYPDASFDKVYSISVVEHIPDSGDTQCLREIARVLAPKGRCALTVPFSPESRTDFKKDFYWSKSSVELPEGVFYQRRYSEEDLRRRLIDPSGLKLRELSFIGEKVLTAQARELSDFLPDVSGPIQPLLSRLFHTPPSPRWQDLAKPLCALLCLEK